MAAFRAELREQHTDFSRAKAPRQIFRTRVMDTQGVRQPRKIQAERFALVRRFERDALHEQGTKQLIGARKFGANGSCGFLWCLHPHLPKARGGGPQKAQRHPELVRRGARQ